MSDIVLVAGLNELNVAMVPIVVAPPSGEILEITWEFEGVTHPISDSMPEMASLLHHFKVLNTGDEASFKVGNSHWDAFQGKEVWAFSTEKIISPGGGVIDWTLWTGWHGTTQTTFYLFADGQRVDEMPVTITVYCRGLCG